MNQPRRIAFALVAGLVATAAGAAEQHAVGIVEVQAAMSDGEQGWPDNGMILLLSEKHDIPMVTVNMAIKAGSMVEPGDKPGLASITA